MYFYAFVVLHHYRTQQQKRKFLALECHCQRYSYYLLFWWKCRSSAENYRPVSLTSLVCKVFESIVRDALVKHLESNLLINDSQHGFRKGRSCLTNLLSFLDTVTGYVDSGSAVDVIFLDFAKAFDKVPNRRLILKLESHGITGFVQLKCSTP